MKGVAEKNWDENFVETKGSSKKNKIYQHELEDLREHIDHVSFNIEKVYQHAKDRSRKEYNKSKQSIRKKFHHSYKNEKSGLQV
ncbi:MAG: hypothetical protein ACXVLQ_08635 [Bacteriovorax sp.]